MEPAGSETDASVLTAPASSEVDHRPRPTRGVIAVFESTASGFAVIALARSLAGAGGVPLTVVAIASKERTDIGCGVCRQGAMFRNELACEFAAADLEKVRNIIDGPPQAGEHAGEAVAAAEVEYVLARGAFARAVAEVADERDADLIVIPTPHGRLRRLLWRDRAEVLRRRGAWSVLVAP